MYYAKREAGNSIIWYIYYLALPKLVRLKVPQRMCFDFGNMLFTVFFSFFYADQFSISARAWKINTANILMMLVVV